MTKKDVYKLQPGTWLRIKWSDSEDTVGLLIGKPEKIRLDKDIDLRMFFPTHTEMQVKYTVHTQIVEKLGTIDIPKLKKAA